jgi:hypothetical protein
LHKPRAIDVSLERVVETPIGPGNKAATTPALEVMVNRVSICLRQEGVWNTKSTPSESESDSTVAPTWFEGPCCPAVYVRAHGSKQLSNYCETGTNPGNATYESQCQRHCGVE